MRSLEEMLERLIGVVVENQLRHENAWLSYARATDSPPSFAPYHGLGDPQGDRRAWTIEVQAHEDVSFAAGGAKLIEIVIATPMLIEDSPDDLVGVARVATAENQVLESIAEGIAARIEEEVR